MNCVLTALERQLDDLGHRLTSQDKLLYRGVRLLTGNNNTATFAGLVPFIVRKVAEWHGLGCCIETDPYYDMQVYQQMANCYERRFVALGEVDYTDYMTGGWAIWLSAIDSHAEYRFVPFWEAKDYVMKVSMWAQRRAK